MSYCIIGMKRTRSSILSYSISNYFTSKNFFGAYDQVTPKLKDNIKFNMLPKTECRNAKLTFLKTGVKKFTELALNKSNSVIKLFPRYMMFHVLPSTTDHSKCVLPKNYNDIIMITDIEECFQLSKFKKIYFLKRNITDAICSYGYGIYINQFQFTNDKQLILKQKKYKSTIIDLESPWLNFCIYEYMLLNHMQIYLDKNKIFYHLLTYDEIPDYCNENYSCEKYYKYSNFDYKKLILNYNELEQYIYNYINTNTKWMNENIVFK
jgi:hypothetical protein